ncbi:RibD family protein [Nocardioides sp.]|uniref:RibD family protein n=1 Tax=Nocardioides sp. TaxID=35761 RepID=UPI00352876CF
MPDRPYVLLSCAISLDGYLDDARPRRLRLSGPADLDRVDEVRATCDAILVGAGTVRKDNPRLLVRSPGRRQARRERGLPSSPLKVTLTGRAGLDPCSRFFALGDVDKLVYCPATRAEETRRRLGGVATVVDAGEPLSLETLLDDLGRRGVRRLLVEGGGTTHTQFLSQGLADELHLAVAPIFVGDSRGRRWVDDGPLPWRDSARGTLLDTRPVGDVVLLRYALSARAAGLSGLRAVGRGEESA